MVQESVIVCTLHIFLHREAWFNMLRVDFGMGKHSTVQQLNTYSSLYYKSPKQEKCTLLFFPLDKPIGSATFHICSLTTDHHNLVIGTSTGKIMAVPLSSLFEEDMGGTGSVYGICHQSSSSAKELQLATSAISLHSHRDERVVGLVHIPLPECATLTGSTHNLVQSTSALLAASSLTALHEAGLQDSVFMSSQHQHGQSKYHSLLVSAGKGHRNYQIDADSLTEDSIALRERSEAFQVMVWGYCNANSWPNCPCLVSFGINCVIAIHGVTVF